MHAMRHSRNALNCNQTSFEKGGNPFSTLRSSSLCGVSVHLNKISWAKSEISIINIHPIKTIRLLKILLVHAINCFKDRNMYGVPFGFYPI